MGDYTCKVQNPDIHHNSIFWLSTLTDNCCEFWNSLVTVSIFLKFIENFDIRKKTIVNFNIYLTYM